MRLRIRVLLVAAGSLAVASGAAAAPFTWELAGTIGDIYTCCGAPTVPTTDPALTSLGVVKGAPFVATITVESSTPDLNPAPTFAEYLGAVLSMSVASGGYSATISGDSTLNVNVTNQAMILDVLASGPDDLFTNPILALEVSAHVPGTFATDALPITPPPLANLDPFTPPPNSTFFGFGTSVFVGGKGTTSELQIRGSINSWVLVPEPSTLALGAFVAALVAARGREPSALR